MHKTVSIIVTNLEGQILLLKRADHKKWYPGKWDIISGKLNEDESPKEGLRRELFEETGIKDSGYVESKRPYIYKERGQKWLVHPYRFQTEKVRVKLNGEHCDYRWVNLDALRHFDLALPVRFELKPFYPPSQEATDS